MTDSDSTDADQRWLAAIWPFVRQHLPPPPCRVVDIGCGPLGGFVQALRADRYEAEGVDPDAPTGPHYHRVEVEEYHAGRPVAAMVASTSLHHVTDPATVVDVIARRLQPGGVLVVIEWARERFDEATARWCFARLADDQPGWLHRHRDDWLASGRPWDSYLADWAATEGIHTGRDIQRALATRFDTALLAHGPYFFADLNGVTTADEQAAIDAGRIQPTGIQYVGRAQNNTT